MASESTVVSAETAKPSRTGSLLREFAQTVAVEERDLSNSTDLLIQAADQVQCIEAFSALRHFNSQMHETSPAIKYTYE